MPDLWAADIFDYYHEAPMLVGVFTSEQEAWDAINIVTDQCTKKREESHCDGQ